MNQSIGNRQEFKQQFKKRCFHFSLSVLKISEHFRQNRINWNLIEKSASETLYWLALLQEINQNEKEQISDLITEYKEIKSILSTIILNTKNNSKF